MNLNALNGLHLKKHLTLLLFCCSIVTSAQSNVRISFDVDNLNEKGGLIQLADAKQGFATQSIVEGVDKDKFLKLLETTLTGLDSSSCEAVLRTKLAK